MANIAVEESAAMEAVLHVRKFVTRVFNVEDINAPTFVTEGHATLVL